MWYFNNATSIYWDDMENFWPNPDGTGTNPSDVPWSASDPSPCDIAPVDGFTGQCVIAAQTLNGGNFMCSIENIHNSGVINGGTFTADGFTNDFGGIVNDAIVSGASINNYGTINGGWFNVDHTDSGTSSGVTFWNPNGVWFYSGELSHNWEDSQNWWSFPNGTGSNPMYTPWTWYDADHKDLIPVIGYSGACFVVSSINGMTATCSIPHVISSGDVLGGTFTGDEFTSSGHVNGGLFTGDYAILSGEVNGGTFTGDYVSINSISINSITRGGVFTGSNCVNYAFLTGGAFSGSNFMNIGTITGGVFTCPTFENNGFIMAGIFGCGSFINGNIISGGIFACPFLEDHSSITGGLWLLTGVLNCNGTPVNSVPVKPMPIFGDLHAKGNIIGAGMA